MKFVLSTFTLAIASVALAQEPPAPSPEDWKIYVEMKVFAASARKLNPLVAEMRDETKVNDAAAKLEKMVESGEAELVGTIASQTIEGHEISAFQGEQIRYPLEFEQPGAIDTKAGEATTPAAQPRDIAYPATTYETRNVGLSLEADVSVSTDGKRFIVTAKPKRTWFLKWDEFENGRLANNDKIIAKQPRFASAEGSSTFAMSNQERVLLGVHSVPGSPDKMEVMVLRVWSTPRKKS
jgi:hypothetical protein